MAMLAAVLGLLATLLSPWQSYRIPAGSMKPALQPGDYVLALPMFAPPRRGEIVIFRHPLRDTVYVKRVIAIAGDQVGLRDGKVILNGAMVPQEPAPVTSEPWAEGQTSIPCAFSAIEMGEGCRKAALFETLPDAPSYVILDVAATNFDDMADVVVPPGHVFVLGDNRDQSSDSRIPQSAGGLGPVPVDHMLARPRIVLFSAPGRRPWNPATWRRGRMLVRVQ